MYKRKRSYQKSFIQAPGNESFSSFWAFTDLHFSALSRDAFYGNPMRMSSHPFLIHDANFHRERFEKEVCLEKIAYVKAEKTLTFGLSKRISFLSILLSCFWKEWNFKILFPSFQKINIQWLKSEEPTFFLYLPRSSGKDPWRSI